MNVKKEAVRAPLAIPPANDSSQQPTPTINIIPQNTSNVKWLMDENVINEPLFCAEFLEEYGELKCIGGEFYNVDGAVSRAELSAAIYNALIAGGVTTSTARRADNLLKSLERYCFSSAIIPSADEIHVNNGVIKITDEWISAPLGTPPPFIAEKKFAINRLNVEYNPEIWTRGLSLFPPHFCKFLDELLDAEDAQTFQEFLGYCLIPSNSAQKALFIIGVGGEGKSRIGIVLNDIFVFTKSAYCGKFHRVENDRFFRANLSDKLLFFDDDIDFEALKSTGTIKSIITAEIPIDVERKGVQSYETLLYSRFLCLGNGSPKTLYDKTDGFLRRLLILSTKTNPAGRNDDPKIAENFLKEKEQIFVFMLEGLRRLLKNNFKFTVSEKTRANIAEAGAENCNIPNFLGEAVEFADELQVTSVSVYRAYCNWCEVNGLTALHVETFSRWLKDNARKYEIAFSTHISDGNGHSVRGFKGMALKT